MKIIRICKKVGDKFFTGVEGEKSFGQNISIEIAKFDDGTKEARFTVSTQNILSGDLKDAKKTLNLLQQMAKNLQSAISYVGKLEGVEK